MNKDLLLTDTEIVNATINHAHRLGRKLYRGTRESDRAIAQAQLNKCEPLIRAEVAQEIFRSLDMDFRETLMADTWLMKVVDYQQLKAKYGVK